MAKAKRRYVNVIRKLPGEQPEMITIGNGHGDIADAVGGRLTSPEFPWLTKDCAVFCLDEGILLGCSPNIAVYNPDWYEPMVIHGPIVITGITRTGAVADLPERRAERVMSVLRTAERDMRILREGLSSEQR